MQNKVKYFLLAFMYSFPKKLCYQYYLFDVLKFKIILNMINPLHAPRRVINKIIKTYLIVKSTFHKPSFTHQEHILFWLIEKCKNTLFGKKYGFTHIQTIKDFQNQVPIHHYKDFEQWIHYMLKGEKNVTYPGKIDRFATSSWTTWWVSKYIPVTKEWLKKSHMKWWAEALNFFCKNNPRSQFLNGKWLVIGWGFTVNPYTGEKNVGFISAILQKNTPLVIKKLLKEPQDNIAFLDDWETKINAIIKHTVHQNITFINGQPGWLLDFLYKTLEYTHKDNILQVWPNLELFFRWGLPIGLYKSQFEKLIPSANMKYYQWYNASEWFFWVQDKNFSDDLLLLIDHWTFYEFIPLEEYGTKNPHVFTLQEIETGKDYVIVLTTCSWLRRYVIGDVIKFTHLKPRRIQVTGRTKYFIDMLGERVFLDHIEKAILQTSKITGTIITDYTVWPKIFEWWWVRWCHEWIIECIKTSVNEKEFAKIVDEELGKINNYYFDERHGTKVIGMPIIHMVKQWTFYQWFKSKNKLGWQHKVPKLSNDRIILDDLLSMLTKE